MDPHQLRRQRWRNGLQTLLLIGGMGLLLALSAELLLGAGVWPWVFVAVVLLLALAPEIPPGWVLGIYRAQPIAPHRSPVLHQLISELAERAGLDRVPRLYWVPSTGRNAFTVGHGEQTAIAVSDGLLRALDLRELAGVLAHEVSHVAHRDLRLLGLADTVSRLTHLLAILGLLAALLSLPLVVLGWAEVSLTGLALLVLAPSLSALLQLALSRTREFAADVEAARLTGDPAALASALTKLEYRPRSPWLRLLLPTYHESEPSLLRTHPPTEERVERLLRLAPPIRARRPPWPGPPGAPPLPRELRVVQRPLRRPFFGIWH